MPSFAIKYPFFILMLCLAIVVVGVTTVARMPVDLFPPIDIPVVVVATFYSGMPPQQIEANITDTFERFFTLGSNIDHIESRSLTGVSLIKVYFQPGTDAGCGGQRDRQPRDGRPATPAARHAASGGAEVRCLEPAGVPGDAEGSGTQRDATARRGTVQRSQPDCERAGRVGTAALWRQVSPDPVLRRSGEAGSGANEPDGRGQRHQRLQQDPARGRRAHRSQRLQHLQQQPTARHLADERCAAEGHRQRRAALRRHRARGRLVGHSVQHRSRGRPEVGLSADPEAGRQQQHHSDRGRSARPR